MIKSGCNSLVHEFPRNNMFSFVAQTLSLYVILTGKTVYHPIIKRCDTPVLFQIKDTHIATKHP